MAGAWQKLTLAVLTFASVAILSVGSANAALYWVGSGLVSSSNLDGSVAGGISSWPPVEPVGPFPSHPEGVWGCDGIAATASRLYWARPETGTISRSNLDGTEADVNFVTGLQNPCGIAADDGHVYWTDYVAGTIGRSNLEGGEIEREFVSGLERPCGVAVGNGFLYWVAAQVGFPWKTYVGRMPVGGGIIEDVYEGGVEGRGDPFCGIALDPTHLYFANSGGSEGTIARTQLDGSDPEPAFVTGAQDACGIAIEGSRIYWVQQDPSARGIKAASLEAPHEMQTVVAEPLGLPCGLAADGTVIPPRPAPSTPIAPASMHPLIHHDFFFDHVRHVKGSAATVVSVEFPIAGSFKVTVPTGLRVRVISGPAPRKVLAGAESRLLRVAPAAGPAGATTMAKLKARGKLRFALTVELDGADGSETLKREYLSLVAHKRRSPRHR